MRVLLAIACGLLMLPRSAKADYFLQNIINNGGVNGNTHGLVFNSVTNTWQTVDDPFVAFGTGNRTTINSLNDEGHIAGLYVSANGQTIGLLSVAIPNRVHVYRWLSALFCRIRIQKRPVPIAAGRRETQSSNSRRPVFVTPPMRKSTSAFAGRSRDSSTFR
jgi:hypothetical protein